MLQLTDRPQDTERMKDLISTISDNMSAIQTFEGYKILVVVLCSIILICFLPAWPLQVVAILVTSRNHDCLLKFGFLFVCLVRSYLRKILAGNLRGHHKLVVKNSGAPTT